MNLTPGLNFYRKEDPKEERKKQKARKIAGWITLVLIVLTIVSVVLVWNGAVSTLLFVGAGVSSINFLMVFFSD